MTIKTIKHSQSIEMFQSNGLKQWAGYEAIAEIEEGEDDSAAAAKLTEKVIGYHAENNKGLHIEVNQDAIPIQKQDPEEIRIGLLIQDIESCKDIKTLESYKFLVKGKPEFQKAYDNKLKQLTNEKVHSNSK